MPSQLIRGINQVDMPLKGCVATIGNFDGVHQGHQALLSNVIQRAKALNLPSLVVIFEPQPLEFLVPQRSVPRLTRFREKFWLLEQVGVDKILVIRFNEDFANLMPYDFIKLLLIDKLHVKHLIIGEDFQFGKGRLGTIDVLKKAGAVHGFLIETQPDIIIGSERISSTRVRRALIAGDLREANQLLGRPYFMMGRVVHGDKLGRMLGFPTANIHLHRKVSPVMGVYVVKVYGINHKPLLGVANVGIRPTVGGTRSLLEVHLFNFSKTIYGNYVSVEFCHKLRDEEHYDTLEALKIQIGIDAEQAIAYFKQQGEWTEKRDINE